MMPAPTIAIQQNTCQWRKLVRYKLLGESNTRFPQFSCAPFLCDHNPGHRNTLLYPSFDSADLYPLLSYHCCFAKAFTMLRVEANWMQTRDDTDVVTGRTDNNVWIR